MPITIPPDQDAAPRCPKCGSPMERRSVVGDLRESSTETHALICTNRDCCHRES